MIEEGQHYTLTGQDVYYAFMRGGSMFLQDLNKSDTWLGYRYERGKQIPSPQGTIRRLRVDGDDLIEVWFSLTDGVFNPEPGQVKVGTIDQLRQCQVESYTMDLQA